MFNLRTVAALAALSVLGASATPTPQDSLKSNIVKRANLESLPLVPAPDQCIPDVPYQILNNIEGGKDLCSSILGITTPVATATVYETTYTTTQVVTAETPYTTNVVIETLTDVVTETQTTSTKVVTLLVKRTITADVPAPTIPAHVAALGDDKISSACSCVVTLPAEITNTLTSTIPLATDTTTTPATVTVDITSTAPYTVTTTTAVVATTQTLRPSACVKNTNAVLNGGFNTSPANQFKYTNSAVVSNAGKNGSPGVKFDGLIHQKGEISVSQNVTMCANATYSLTVNYDVVSLFALPDTQCKVYASMNGVDFAVSKALPYYGTWTALTGTLNATVAVGELKVRAECRKGNALKDNSFVLAIDDVSLINQTDL